MCISYLAGIIAGVIALTRKKTVPGILAIVAFVFLGLEILLRILLWSILGPERFSYESISWISYCTTSPLLILGTIALVVIVFASVGKKPSLPPLPGTEELPK